MPAPIFTWTGFYLGVDVGGGFGSSSWSNIVVPSDTGENYPGTFAKHDVSGAVGGIQAGYNIQVGSFVYGVNGEINLAGVDGNNRCFGNYGDYNAQCTDHIRALGDLLGRVGFTPMDRMLLYFQGGLGYENGTEQPAGENYYGSAVNGYQSTSFDRWGYVLGGGADFAVTDHWIIGADYKYYGFDKTNISFTPVAPVEYWNPPFSADTKNNVQTVTVHIGYKF